MSTFMNVYIAAYFHGFTAKFPSIADPLPTCPFQIYISTGKPYGVCVGVEVKGPLGDSSPEFGVKYLINNNMTVVDQYIRGSL